MPISLCFKLIFKLRGCRYYSTRLWIGTPPQRFALIVDTGSTVTYVPCSTCEQCGNHQVPSFLTYILSFNHLLTKFILLPQNYSINLKYPMLGYESGEASIGHKTSAEFKLNILLTLVSVTNIRERDNRKRETPSFRYLTIPLTALATE